VVRKYTERLSLADGIRQPLVVGFTALRLKSNHKKIFFFWVDSMFLRCAGVLGVLYAVNYIKNNDIEQKNTSTPLKSRCAVSTATYINQ